MGGGLELGSQLGIHVDHDLLLLRHQGVALLNLLRDPISEALAQHGGTDVDDPLFGDLWNVNLVGHVGFDMRHLSNIGKDLLQRKILVLGHVQGLHLIIWDIRLLAADQVFQEINRDVVCKNGEN